MSLQSRSSRIDGLAIFAAAAFALGLATILTLDRIGAPDGLVRAIGPVLALVGVTVFGLGARNADLGSFLAAARRVAPFYGGLCGVAVAGGVALCLYPDFASLSDPPLLGVLIGLALGATVFGPLLRRFGATSLADVIATRFSRSPIRLVSGAVVWTTAALTALAGFEVAVVATQALLTTSRGWAEAIVALVLFLSVTPGGLTSVIATAAASGGALVMIALLTFASRWRLGVFPPDWKAALLPTSFTIGAPKFIATTAALAGFFALEPAAVGSHGAGAAIRAGLGAVFLGVALAGLAGAALSIVPVQLATGDLSPVAASLVGAAILASAMALARLGVQGASRALGVALADPPKPYPTLASVRLARMRAAQLVVVIGCVACDSEGLLDARTALISAMALSLALTTPLVALALIPRVGPLSASFGMLCALAVIIVRVAPMTGMPGAAELFEGALMAAAAAFAAGALACLILPRRAPAPTAGAFDLFADAPGWDG
jgi:hypothetical protein